MFALKRWAPHAAAACLAVLIGLEGARSRATAQAQDDPAAVTAFNLAAQFQNIGQYEKASARWTEFLTKFPQDKRAPKARYYLGVCQLHAKKLPEAIASFREVLDKHPQFDTRDGARFNLSMALYQQAEAAPSADAWKAAAAEFAKVAADHPQSRYAARALYFRGEALVRGADPDGAIAAYRDLLAKFAASDLAPDAAYAVGVTLQEQGKEKEASEAFTAFLANQAFAQTQYADEVRLRLALSHFAQQDYAKAEPLFAAAAAKAEFALADFALLRQAQCQLEAGKTAEAVQTLAALQQKFPQSTYKGAALTTQGKALFNQQKYAEAAAPLTQAAALDAPEAGEAAYWLGRALLKQNKAQEALAVLEPAAQKHAAGDFGPYLELTRLDALYDLPNRRAETAALYDQFAQKHAAHSLAPQARYMSALAALGQQDYTAARTRAEAFLADAKLKEHELAGDVLFVAAEATLLGRQDGDQAALDKAGALYEDLLTRFPNHVRAPRAAVRSGWRLLQGEKYDEAIQKLTAAAPKLTDPALNAEARLLIGRCQAAAGRAQEAVTAYDAAIAAAPQWERGDEVLLAAAAALRELNKPADAAQRLEKLLAQFAQSKHRDQAVYQLAEIAAADGKPDVAIQRFTEVTAQYAQSPLAAPAYYGLAAAHFAKPDYPAAIAALTQLLDKFPNSTAAPQGRYLRGLCRQRTQEFAPALADLEAYLATKPEGVEALDARYAVALCRTGLGQHADAAKDLAALAKDAPTYPRHDQVLYELGHAHAAANQPAESAAAFLELAQKHPESPLAAEAWFRVGRGREEAALGLDDPAAQPAAWAAAEEAYAAGLERKPAPELAEKLSYKLADALYRQKKYAPAVTRLQAQLKEFPSGELAGPAAFLAGECLFQQEQFPQALPLFEQAAANPQATYRAQALYRAGASAGNAAQWAASQKAYQDLLTAFPDFAQKDEARYGLGWALQNQQKTAEARTAYTAVEGRGEAAAKARFMLGELAFGEKKYDEAIDHFFLVTGGFQYPEWQALARFEAGRCFSEQGEKELARQQFQMLIDAFPEHPKAKDAAQLLANLK